MTMREAPKKTGAEPDECYIIGPDKERPDLVIEVVWTSGGLDKREIYRRLGVPELWTWEDDNLTVLSLRGNEYVPVPGSVVLPELDLPQWVRFARRTDQSQAVFDYGDELRKR